MDTAVGGKPTECLGKAIETWLGEWYPTHITTMPWAAVLLEAIGWTLATYTDGCFKRFQAKTKVPMFPFLQGKNFGNIFSETTCGICLYYQAKTWWHKSWKSTLKRSSTRWDNVSKIPMIGVENFKHFGINMAKSSWRKCLVCVIRHHAHDKRWKSLSQSRQWSVDAKRWKRKLRKTPGKTPYCSSILRTYRILSGMSISLRNRRWVSWWWSLSFS